MQISEEEYYATLLSNPDYSETKFSIYRFKNLINGKIYIGQTTVPVRKRLIQHMTFSRPWTKCHKTYFHNAIYKYGLNNFDFSVIEICKSQEELDIREKYWINHYKSNDKQFGYNYDKHGNFIAVWNKCKDVVDFLYGIGANGNLSRNIKLNNKRGKLGFSKNGYIWSFFAPQGKEEL